MNHDSVGTPWTSLAFLRKLAWYGLFRKNQGECNLVSLLAVICGSFGFLHSEELLVGRYWSTSCWHQMRPLVPQSTLLHHPAFPFETSPQLVTNSLPLKKRALQFFWYLILNYMTLTLLLVRYKSSTYRKFYIFF